MPLPLPDTSLVELKWTDGRWFLVHIEVKNKVQHVRYFATIDSPEETTEKTKEPLSIRKITKHSLATTGIEIVPIDLNLVFLHKLAGHIRTKVKIIKPERSVTHRSIFYPKSWGWSATTIEKKLGLNKIRPFIAHYLKTEQKLEIWNWFISSVNSDSDVTNQIVHRDSISDSVSVFLFLDNPTSPPTQFFPFTHRLVEAIRSGISKPVHWNAVPGEILLMDGKLLHGGTRTTTTIERPRILMVFQYRIQSHGRAILPPKALWTRDSYPTIFDIK